VLVAYGPWEDHVGEYWNHRLDKNVLFLCYEDLHQVKYEKKHNIFTIKD